MALRAAQSPPRADDSTLVARCAAGDRSAWDELVVRFGRLVYAVIVRTLRRHGVLVDDPRLDELFSATFLALADMNGRRLRQWDGRCALASWIRLVAGSTVLDAVRAERRATARIDNDVAIETLALDDSGALERALRAERLLRLERALATLGDGDRQLVRLLYMEGLGPGEAAERLGVQPGTLYTRKNRALERLRAAYRAAGTDDV